MKKKYGRRILAVFMTAIMLGCGIFTGASQSEQVYAADEKAVAAKSWSSVEPILKQKLGVSYSSIGRCTGFVYWALENAYGVNWGDNSTVDGLEDKLKDRGITKVAEGANGTITSSMKPGDIIIFLENGSGTHCAILGEGGKMYHATTSSGVKYGPTLSEWMDYPDADKNCDSYRIYRGLNLTGSLTIIKSSGNPALSDGNSCYSLAGAKYGLYKGSSLIGTLTTDANGKATLSNIPYGTYTLKEISGAKGYAVDTTAYSITINSKSTSKNVKDMPQGDPAVAVVYKLDKDTHESWSENNLPQGSASLEGAEYTISYYAAYYDDDTDFSKITPTRSWVVKTNENGRAVLTESLLVSGDDFYYSSGGSVTLPMGTVTVQETKAPTGYLIDDTLHVSQITPEGKMEAVSTYNIPMHKEDVKRGGVIIRKNDMQTGENSQGDATFEGAEFSIINRSENHVFVDGKVYSSGETVKVIKTNASGIAKTDEDTLPYGEYTIIETKAPEGYLNEGILEKNFSIRIDGEMIDLTDDAITNDVIRGGIQLQKWDRELGKSEAVAGKDYSTVEKGAKLSGIEFTITNNSKASVIVKGREYAPDEVIAKFETAWNEEKNAYTVETPADYLPYGTYAIKETKSNGTYVLTDGKARIVEIRENGKIVTVNKEGNDLIFKNFVVRADLELVKAEDGSLKRMSGIPFKLTNTATNESHVIVTDENGYASTSADWNRHTENTNANDKLLEMDKITEADINMSSGVWFGLGEFGSQAEPNDTLGAIPYGTYTLDELRCDANAEHKLIENITIKVSRNGAVIDLGTITNDMSDTEVPPQPEGDEPKNPDDRNSPKTGDFFPLFIIIALIVIAGTGAYAVIRYKGKDTDD